MIKIELSGTGDEVRKEILRLLGLQETMAEPESPPQEEKSKVSAAQTKPVKTRRTRKSRKAAAPAPVPWTEEEAETLLSEIKPNAKKIMAELAKKPEGYRRSELVEALGSKEQSIRGQLSSVGAALKRMGGKPSPILKEKVDGELIYKIDSVVAGLVK